MFETIIPETFASVLAAYAPCFQARSYATFQWLVLGWVQCLERRTLTAVALASGAVGARHIRSFTAFSPGRSGVWTPWGRSSSSTRCDGSPPTSRCTCWATTRWRASRASV